VVQTVASWDELVQQVSDSRMLGGVHYRFSNEAGEEIGRRAARIAIEKALRPLTWLGSVGVDRVPQTKVASASTTG
jgi:hypothetical protein